MPPAKAAPRAYVPHFVGDIWTSLPNDDRFFQDRNIVDDLRWQLAWEADETLDDPTTLRIEMERQLHRWTGFMRTMHVSSNMLTMHRQKEERGRTMGNEAEVFKWRDERLRLRTHLNQIVAANVMLFHRCCRYMGTGPDGEINGDRKGFRPDFLAWSETWFDMIITYSYRNDIIEENLLAYEGEFLEGPPENSLEPGAWRYVAI